MASRITLILLVVLCLYVGSHEGRRGVRRSPMKRRRASVGSILEPVLTRVVDDLKNILRGTADRASIISRNIGMNPWRPNIDSTITGPLSVRSCTSFGWNTIRDSNVSISFNHSFGISSALSTKPICGIGLGHKAPFVLDDLQFALIWNRYRKFQTSVLIEQMIGSMFLAEENSTGMLTCPPGSAMTGWMNLIPCQSRSLKFLHQWIRCSMIFPLVELMDCREVEPLTLDYELPWLLNDVTCNCTSEVMIGLKFWRGKGDGWGSFQESYAPLCCTFRKI